MTGDYTNQCLSFITDKKKQQKKQSKTKQKNKKQKLFDMTDGWMV